MHKPRRAWILALPLLATACRDCGEGLENLTAQGELDPAVYSFGVVRAGATCEADVTIRNKGQGELSVNGAEIRDDGSNGKYSVVTFPTQTVLGGGEDVIRVRYAPTDPSNGLHTASLVVLTNDPDNGGKVVGTITGEATTSAAGKLLPECKVNLSDANAGLCRLVEFGSTPKVEVGQAGGLSRTVTVKNDGTATFRILGAQILPADGATQQPEFVVELINNEPPGAPVDVLPSREGDCGQPVMNAGAGIPIAIKFTPTRVGIQTARLQIITDAPTAGTGDGNPPLGQANVNLSGVGSGVGLAVDPEFISFGSVAAGATETRNVRVANLDINPASVNSSCIDIDEDGTCYEDPTCTSGCASDPGDVDCTGGDADPATGLNCDVQGQGKGFRLEATDAMPGGSDEVTVDVTWAPPAAASFSKNLLLMTNIQGNRTYAIRLTGGVAGNIVVSPASLLVPASTDMPNATGSATFTVSNDGQAPLVLTNIEFTGSASIGDDFTLTRAGDTAFRMNCTRGASESSCTVPAWTTPITLGAGTSDTFTVAYADNDPVVAVDTFTINITHNGTGGSPYAVDVSVCKPASGTSARPTCP